MGPTMLESQARSGRPSRNASMTALRSKWQWSLGYAAQQVTTLWIAAFYLGKTIIAQMLTPRTVRRAPSKSPSDIHTQASPIEQDTGCKVAWRQNPTACVPAILKSPTTSTARPACSSAFIRWSSTCQMWRHNLRSSAFQRHCALSVTVQVCHVEPGRALVANRLLLGKGRHARCQRLAPPAMRPPPEQVIALSTACVG